MWTPQSIKGVNFRSYTSFSYEFTQGDVTLVYAKNFDEPQGSDSNGAGKSAILLAITVALVDIPNKDLDKEDYVLDFTDEATVDFTLVNPVLKKKLRIVRVIRRGNKSNTIEIWENDKRNTQITGVPEGNKRILELLDISREDILNYYLINQQNKHSFFGATDTDQKKIIARFTNSDSIDKALKAVDVDVKKLVSEMDEIDEQMSSSSTRIELWEAEIVEEEENKEEEAKKLLEEYRAELTEANGELEALNAEQKQSSNLIALKSTELTELGKVLGNPEKLTRLLKKHKTELSGKQEEEQEVLDIKSGLEKKLAGKIVCPECKHEWLLASPEEDVKMLQDTLNDCISLSETNEEELEELRKKVNKTRERLNSININKEKYDYLDEFVEKEQRNLKRTNTKIEEKKKQITKIEQKIKEAKEFKKNVDKINSLKDKVEKENETISLLSEQRSVLENKKSELDFWVVNFGMSGFKTFLINKVLSTIEGYVNYNLRRFQVNLTVKINGYKVLKGGKIKENIDVLVSRDEENWKKYKRFSGGQRRRIDVCGILTLQKLINNASKSGGLDFLGLDEFFEGLDTTGQRAVLSVLNRCKTTTLVVSHNNNDIGAENRIDIEYRNSISQII